MRLLFVLPTINSGGAERVTLNIANSMVCSVPVHLVIFDDSNALEGLVSPEIVIHRLGTGRTIKSVWQLARAIRNIQPTDIFSSHSRVVAVLAVILYFHREINLISRMQGMPSFEMQHGEYSFARRLIYAFGYRASDVVIAQTTEMKNDCISVFNVPSEKIKIIHNPLDVDSIMLDAGARSPFDGHVGRHIVLSGRIRRERGFDTALRAIKLAGEELNEPISVHILGPDRGSLKDLKVLVSELGLGNVFFHGFVENPFVFYFNCDLFVLSSRWEGLPNAFIENVFLGTPIVATRCVPIVEEIASNRSNVALCEVDDVHSMAKLIIALISRGARLEVGYTHAEANIQQEIFFYE